MRVRTFWRGRRIKTYVPDIGYRIMVGVATKSTLANLNIIVRRGREEDLSHQKRCLFSWRLVSCRKRRSPLFITMSSSSGKGISRSRRSRR